MRKRARNRVILRLARVAVPCAQAVIRLKTGRGRYNSGMNDELAYTCTCADLEQTGALASQLAPLLRAGDVVMLNGDLGAGKTSFVQAVARALGVTDDVTSPTFTIQLTYESGSLVLNHFDLYRLDDADQLYDLGYWETLEGCGVSFVEWGEKFPDEAPEDYLELLLSANGKGGRDYRAIARGKRANQLLFNWVQAAPDAWHRLGE